MTFGHLAGLLMVGWSAGGLWGPNVGLLAVGGVVCCFAVVTQVLASRDAETKAEVELLRAHVVGLTAGLDEAAETTDAAPGTWN